jgi:predicted transcriptional regulator
MPTTASSGRVVPDLRKRRRAAGISQLQLAVAAAVNVNTAARADVGARVSADVAARLERAVADAEAQQREASA